MENRQTEELNKQKQRPKLPIVNLTCYASKYKEQKLRQRYILKSELRSCVKVEVAVLLTVSVVVKEHRT